MIAKGQVNSKELRQSIIAYIYYLCLIIFPAKHLDLYQVLAPNAYSYKEEFIPVIKRAVQSQVHEVSTVFDLLTLCILMNFSIWFDTMSLGQFILHIEGHRLEFSNEDVLQSLKIILILGRQCRP